MSQQDILQPPVSSEEAPSDTAPRKLDPETLALRAAPARAIRFRRGAIIGIATAGAMVLMATAWMALQPGSLHMAVGSSNDAVAAKAPAEAVNSLPGTYADVPKLGPPLPGDLGRGILEHQGASVVQPAATGHPERRPSRQPCSDASSRLPSSGPHGNRVCCSSPAVGPM
jgi:type IV secretion system protein VirB10